MKRLLEDIPSIPQIPSFTPLNLGITTRVFAKQLVLQRERERSRSNSLDPSQASNNGNSNRRRSSKFLDGTAIPNSVIRSEMQQADPVPKDAATIRRERNEFVDKLLQRLQPNKAMYRSIYDEDLDREALNKIKRELQKRSLLPLTSRNEADRDGSNPSICASPNRSVKGDPWEELREKRRITRRTSILAPLRGERRSTYESIKKAIQNSKVMQQLLNADNIEEQKVKQVQTGKSLLEETDPRSVPVQESASNLRGSRKRERKGARRKHSLKSEKSSNLPEKLISKKKAFPDVRKHSK